MSPYVPLATIRQAVILVGGRGTRLGSLTEATPKPLLEVAGHPFLFWLLRELCRYGVEDVLLLAGHLANRIEAALPDLVASLPRKLRVSVLVEHEPAGTGGALVRARDRLEPRVLVCNGDTILDANLARLLADAASDGPDVAARLLLLPMPVPGRYGAVATEGDRVVSFGASESGPVRVNTGIVVLSRAALDAAPAVGNLERDILAPLAAAGRLRASVASGWFCDIGVPKDLALARDTLSARLLRPALILDRDGTLNVDHGYVGDRNRFDWIPGAREAVRTATDRGWHVFIATNQSGVARGFYDEADLRTLHAWIDDTVRQIGGTVDDWRYCPYHDIATVDRYRRSSEWRKPGPGMLTDLARAWLLDPARCVMLGDQPSDVAAAHAAGMAGHLFTGGDLNKLVTAVLDSAPTAGSR